MKVCSTPGCPNLTTVTRCDKHHKEKRRKQDRLRPTARERGYNRRWEQTRRAYLRHFPHCHHCTEPAVDVHHLDGQGPSGPLGHEWSNLQGLCKPCHAQVTAREQPGGWNR